MEWIAITIGFGGVGLVILAMLVPRNWTFPKTREQVAMENQFADILVARGFSMVVDLPPEASLAIAGSGKDVGCGGEDYAVRGERQEAGLVILICLQGYRRAGTSTMVAIWGPASTTGERTYKGSSLAYSANAQPDRSAAARWQVLVGPLASFFIGNLRVAVVEDFVDGVVSYLLGNEAESERARLELANDILHR